MLMTYTDYSVTNTNKIIRNNNEFTLLDTKAVGRVNTIVKESKSISEAIIPTLSKPLAHFLRMIKTDTSETSWRTTRQWRDAYAYLSEWYYTDGSMIDFMHLLLKMYKEASEVKELGLPYGTTVDALLQRIIIEPLKEMTFLTQTNPDKGMFNNLEGVYNEIINGMISDLMLTRIGWCRDQMCLT